MSGQLEIAVIPVEKAVKAFKGFYRVNAQNQCEYQEILGVIPQVDKGNYTKYIRLQIKAAPPGLDAILEDIQERLPRLEKDRVVKAVDGSDIFCLYLPSRQLIQAMREAKLISRAEQAQLETDIRGSIPVHIS